MFQRVAAGGWQAELQFPAPVIQLHHYLAGDSNDAGDAFPDEAIPVRHTITLVLQPPHGEPTTVSVQADGSTTVTKGGAQLATSQSLFVGNRLLIAVPKVAAVDSDWSVQAVIRLAGDQPLRPVVGGRTGLPAELVYATQPAIVGVLTGDDARGPEPLLFGRAILNSTNPAAHPSEPVDVPARGRPISLRLERSGKSVEAVVTVDAPPRAPRTSDVVNGEPVQQETLRLSIAPDVQDGLGLSRIDVEFPYPTSTCGQPMCPMSTVASVLIGGNYLGTVPVTVSGKDIRFDLGHFTPSTQPPPANAPTIPTDTQFIGTTTSTLTLDAQDLDMVPLDPAAPPWSGQTTIALDGTSISITSPAGQTAKGVVNPFTGYFFASDNDEMWSGFLGKQGWYERITRQAQKTAAIGGVHADISGTDEKNRPLLASYYWNQKLRQGEESLPATLRGILAAWRPAHGYQGYRANIQIFNSAIDRWVEEFPEDHGIFPLDIDPVTVPVPAPIAFPFAEEFPTLAPEGGQWEIAAGIQLAGTHGNLLFSYGPYVPASSLLGSSQRAPSTPMSPTTKTTS